MSKRKNLHNKEVFQRINYLHQASKIIASKNKTLSCYYGSLLKDLRNKAVIKIDPSIKRDLCKRCSISFNQETCKLVSYSDSLVEIECGNCGYRKKYPVNDTHKLWIENEQSVIETLEFNDV
ncbi:unnamed protein product [Chironomus riparius]|uniref:Uncharacterized protein n=1 Tax=Chironomus riparius TaxID=315576 RepID=A0A9N9RV90_9DIPT|nr:unnamed protein product [Chironomus riparius]